MAGFGLAEADLAKVLDIEPETLRLRYRRELETAQIKANARVAECLFRQATGEGRQSATAAIFLAEDPGALARDGAGAGGRPDASQHQRAVRLADGARCVPFLVAELGAEGENTALARLACSSSKQTLPWKPMR